jgi:hypothetical protein
VNADTCETGQAFGIEYYQLCLLLQVWGFCRLRYARQRYTEKKIYDIPQQAKKGLLHSDDRNNTYLTKLINEDSCGLYE